MGLKHSGSTQRTLFAAVALSSRWTALTTLALVSAFAQSIAEIDRIVQSPYEIQRFVNQTPQHDWKWLWKALELGDEIFLPQCEKESHSPQDCEAELITIRQPANVILLLRHKPSMFEVYLRFVPETAAGTAVRWRLTGQYEPFVKYFAPTHKVSIIGNRRYLLITGQGNAGTCLTSRVEHWVDLTAPGMKPVFSRTVDGHRCQSSIPDRAVNSKVMSVQMQPNARITLSYKVDFSAATDDGPDIEAGQRTDTVVYVKRAGEYEIDSRLSTLSKTDVIELYENLEADPPREKYLRYAFDRLKQIASGPRGPEQSWLSAFLRKCSATPEKRALTQLLRGASNGKHNGKQH